MKYKNACLYSSMSARITPQKKKDPAQIGLRCSLGLSPVVRQRCVFTRSFFAEDPGEKNGESRAKDRQQDVKGRIRCRWCHWPGGHVQDGFEKLVHKNEEPSFKIEASVKCDIVF